MADLWRVLIEFIFRVTFGVALSMAITPPKLVTSGYYRVHLWVLMGFNTFAAVIAYSNRSQLDELVGTPGWLLGLALSLTAASYLGGAIWLCERATLGRRMLVGITCAALVASCLATPWSRLSSPLASGLACGDLVSGGLIMGSILAAMFLGHWYLNTPTMELLPLKRLVVLIAVAVAARMVTSGVGLALHLGATDAPTTEFWAFVALRWLAGLIGTLAMAWLTWETLKVPNTQSATGLLYAGVILVFIGELTSQLLSVGAAYPL